MNSRVWKVPIHHPSVLSRWDMLERQPGRSSVSRLTIKINELFLLRLELFRCRKISLDDPSPFPTNGGVFLRI